MAAQENKTFTVEDADVKFRDFSGKVDKYNQEGHRSFTVALPEDVAEQMAADGWHIRWLKPQQEGDPPGPPVINVRLRYDIRPPRVVLLTSTTRTQLNEDSIDMLDWADIKTLDFKARGFNWEGPGGKSGIKAYCQSLFVTINEDDLDRKYNIYENPPQEDPF